MARHLLILADDVIRQRAKTFIDRAPVGYRVLFQEPKRSNEQNDYMWALLTDVSRQRLHMGVKHTPEVWKSIFMAALGHEMKFVPSLEGDSVIPIGMSTSKLSVGEMSDLITFIIQWGDAHGIEFHDGSTRKAA